MDPWQQSVENRLGSIQAELLDVRAEIRELRSDVGSQFRWLMGILITMIVLFFGGFGSLLAVMARGFGWL